MICKSKMKKTRKDRQDHPRSMVIVSVFVECLSVTFLDELPFEIACSDTDCDKNPRPFESVHACQQFRPYSSEPVSILACYILFRKTIDFLDMPPLVYLPVDKPDDHIDSEMSTTTVFSFAWRYTLYTTALTQLSLLNCSSKALTSTVSRSVRIRYRRMTRWWEYTKLTHSTPSFVSVIGSIAVGVASVVESEWWEVEEVGGGEAGGVATADAGIGGLGVVVIAVLQAVSVVVEH